MVYYASNFLCPGIICIPHFPGALCFLGEPLWGTMVHFPIVGATRFLPLSGVDCIVSVSCSAWCSCSGALFFYWIAFFFILALLIASLFEICSTVSRSISLRRLFCRGNSNILRVLGKVLKLMYAVETISCRLHALNLDP